MDVHDIRACLLLNRRLISRGRDLFAWQCQRWRTKHNGNTSAREISAVRRIINDAKNCSFFSFAAAAALIFNQPERANLMPVD